MVQREVAERFAAGRGRRRTARSASRSPSGPTPASSATSRRRCSSRGRTSSRRSSRSPATSPRHRPGDAVRRWCDGVRAAAQDAAPSLAGTVAEQVRGAGVDADRPTRGTRRRRLVPARRDALTRSPDVMTDRPSAVRAGAREADVVAADHRRARRRLPPARRGDGQPRPPRRAHDRPGRTGIAVSGPFADGRADRRSNLVARRSTSAATSAASAIDKRIPHGGGLGGGSTDAAAVLRWAGSTPTRRRERARELGADIPFCLVGGRARVRGIGEIVDRSRTSIAR